MQMRSSLAKFALRITLQAPSGLCRHRWATDDRGQADYLERKPWRHDELACRLAGRV